MWHRLSVTLLLVASMARSVRSSGSIACPDNCHCIILTTIRPNEEVNSNRKNNNSIEARCVGIPKLEYLPENCHSLIVRGTKSRAITKLMRDLENNEKLALRELALINCSLIHFNVTLSRITKDLGVSLSLDLSKNEIVETEELRIRDVERLAELDLTENRLTRVSSEAFAQYRGLVKLLLRRNAIGIVKKNAFAGLDRLESLDLSDNRLVSLAEDAFVPLCYLKSLNLSGNRLGILGEKWFDELGRGRGLDVLSRGDRKQTHQQLETSSRSEDIEISLVLGSVRRLETIDASRIGLERVPSALTRSVRSLKLAGNRLTVIRGGDFDSYPLLRVLDLSYNFISTVENDALGRLEILEELDLSGNRLRELPQSLPCALRRLFVRENFLGKLGTRDLDGLTKLETLLINDNNISVIEEGSMFQLSLLNELDVSDNPIKQLPADTFEGPDNLVVLRMSGLVTLQCEHVRHADMAFPVPAPEKLVILDLSGSPALAAQLLADEAALSACKSLRRLDVSRTNLTELRSDLPYLLPQLRILGLSGNQWNCSREENRINWLARWTREHEEILPYGECTFVNGSRSLLVELPIPDSSSTTMTTSFAEDSKEASRAIDVSSSSSEQQRITTILGAHPGFVILAGAAFGALILALSVLITRRRNSTIDDYTENYEQRRPIITELW